MVIVLRIVGGLLALLCLALAGAWLAADLYAPRLVGSTLGDMGLADVLSIGRVHLPRPDVARAHDIELRDPATGEVVAHVDDLEFRYELPGLGGWSVRPVAVVGRGGRVRMSRDADDLGFVRALEHVIDTVNAWAEARAQAPSEEEAEGEPAGPPALPSLDFREIEVVLQLPGLPLETLPGCDVSVALLGHGTHVLVHTNGRRGQILLEFGPDALERIRVIDVPVAPAFALFLPEGGELLARELRPTGLLQFELERSASGEVTAHGQLDEASLRPPRLPFPLERSSLPFVLDGERFTLDEARLRFDGGEVLTSVTHEPGSLVITLDAVDARFRADFLELFPQGRELTWLRCEDGGNIELHLRLEQRTDPEAPLEQGLAGEGLSVRGWGGVLLHRVWLGPTPQTQVAVDEVVGSFDLRDRELVVRETSGLFADGVLRVRGRLDGTTGDLELTGSVFDADLALVRRELGGDEGPSDISGSLQGRVVFSGRVGEAGSARGQGQLSVRGGNLWSIKVLDAIVQALSLKRPGSSESHRLEVGFEIEGEQIDINDLLLDSEFLSLYGQGRIRRLRDLDIDITPITVPLGPLGDLIEYVEKQLIKVELRGTLSEPRVRVIPIKAVTQPVGAFWGWLTGLFGGGSEPAPDAPGLPDEGAPAGEAVSPATGSGAPPPGPP